MPSPFPGVDPYLEEASLWEDVHADLATELRAQLQPQLRPRYFAALTPYVTYDDISIGETEAIKPDVAVLASPSRPFASAAMAVLEAPFTALSEVAALELPAKTQRIEVRRVGTDTLVTVIEILSPANKRPGNSTHMGYLQKRRDLLQSNVHFLEIDLLRRGVRWPLRTPPEAPYFVFLSRVEDRPRVGIWPLTFRERPARIPVPLRAPDPDVAFDLGEALARVYERGAYDLRIDYRRDPPPPVLTRADDAWLDAQLREAGLREG